MVLIKEFMNRINKSTRTDNGTTKYISLSILKKINNCNPFLSAKEFASDIGVSNAMLTKYTKSMGYKNFSEIMFLVRSSIKLSMEKNGEVTQPSMTKASKLISESRKIFFIGVSSGYISNTDFAQKLNRLDKWTVLPPNKYEQIGQATLLTEKDLIILNSVSLQHTWMLDIISNTKAKVILITASNKKVTCDILFKYKVSENTSFKREVTAESRIEVLKIFDEIFKCMINSEKNKEQLIKTSYYHK